MKINGESHYYFENKVPQTVLDLAVEKCGYQFASPDSITASVKEACLDCSWLEEPLYLDATHFSRLEKILKSAKLTGVGNCGYGAKLTLTLENIEKPAVASTEENTEKSVAETMPVDTSKVSGIVVTNGNTGEKITQEMMRWLL